MVLDTAFETKHGLLSWRDEFVVWKLDTLNFCQLLIVVGSFFLANMHGGVPLFHNIICPTMNQVYLNNGDTLHKGGNETWWLGVWYRLLVLSGFFSEWNELKHTLNLNVCYYVFSWARDFLLKSSFSCKIFCGLLCCDKQIPSSFASFSFVRLCGRVFKAVVLKIASRTLDFTMHDPNSVPVVLPVVRKVSSSLSGFDSWVVQIQNTVRDQELLTQACIRLFFFVF